MAALAPEKLKTQISSFLAAKEELTSVEVTALKKSGSGDLRIDTKVKPEDLAERFEKLPISSKGFKTTVYAVEIEDKGLTRSALHQNHNNDRPGPGQDSDDDEDLDEDMDDVGETREENSDEEGDEEYHEADNDKDETD
ncbi:MAG: hypothetical protein M1818_002453 [Claussenomyces sp. TS43310]|nr:MAG: hypothetical protein M1818_002453 [Claussenomyces sp. TS43310]